MHIYSFYNDFSVPRLTQLTRFVSSSCISEMAALICTCDTPLELILHGLIRRKFILRKGAESPTAIVVPLVWLLARFPILFQYSNIVFSRDVLNTKGC